MKITHTKTLPEVPTSHHSNILKKVFINNQSIPNLTNFSAATLQANQKVEAHVHPTMYEVFYIQQGQIIFTINQQKITATAGDCITIEPNETHSLHNTTNSIATIMYFGIATN